VKFKTLDKRGLARFKCQACRREFSVTTGTVFAFRKMSFQDILAGLWFSVNSVKGKSALQLSRELGCQYKTAWVLLMKMREAISTRRFRMMLEGEIHIDGKYAGGHIKPGTARRIASIDDEPRTRTSSASRS
jgi:transposase-like protein